MRRVCVTGGAGFIGSNLVDVLLADGIKVRVIDNFRTGRPKFVSPGVEVFDADLTTDHVAMLRAFDGMDWVCHFAANADVRHGLERPFYDLEQNTNVTAHVLSAMRHVGVKKIFFASTASVYGNTIMDRIPENAPFPMQASLYGASKVACEGLITAYCEGFGFTAGIGRWVQAVGERYLHGHVIDFVRKLLENPNEMEILGDGSQAKSGIYVKDLAEAVYTVMKAHDNDSGAHVYNIGTDETYTVDESAELISGIMGLTPTFTYTGRKQGGWVGDNPRVLLNTDRINELGWKPTLTIPEAIERTTRWLLSDECTYL